MNAPRYRIERVLGRGRHATLWLAMDMERGERTALKIAARGCLRREFDALQAVEDERIVKAHDCGVLPDGRPYLAMEHVRGGDLADARLPEGGIADALHEAALALAAVHRRGLVHRDVKPAHLLLRADNSVALCDFGSACHAGAREDRAAPSVVGTPRYAAPEQMEGASPSPAADVYSLGICAFELLAGKPPFGGETLTELFSQHLCAPVPHLPADAAHWQPLVDTLLAKNPAKRPADGAAVLAQLATLREIHCEPR
jgi:serine/threonine protein kinase